MCSINGIFACHYAANGVDRAELARTRDHMETRGPDGCLATGAWGLGRRRLAIIDLSDAGAQPMMSADGRLAVTFNGEMYDHRELRRGLEASGCVFHSRCDTEVLLHLYARRGAAMVDDLRSMFAFAIWDGGRRTLFLARDPYGIKPLYYADDGWTFRFASALLAGGAVSREAEPAGHVGFCLWGSVPEPFTTYQAVRALPAGATLLIDRIGAQEPRRCRRSIARIYCGAEAPGRVRRNGEDAGPPELRDALIDNVRHHVLADVPIGAFLSAGIDSGALVGPMRDAGQDDIQTVTLAFEEFQEGPEDEAPLAAEVAPLYGARHKTRMVSEAEFSVDLPRILAVAAPCPRQAEDRVCDTDRRMAARPGAGRRIAAQSSADGALIQAFGRSGWSRFEPWRSGPGWGGPSDSPSPASRPTSTPWCAALPADGTAVPRKR